MAKNSRTRVNAPQSCRDCDHWAKVSRKIRVYEVLESAIDQFEKKIVKKDFEPTVAEYVKLLQLGQELAQEDELKEIKVTWVGPNEASESEK